MSTRHLIAAAFLVGSACGAQADVLPASTSTAQSGFLSSWTTGGTDVASTGVLGSGTTLVGGGSTGVAQALYQKASANVSATDGKINLSMAEGLNGTYVVKTGNKALAAMVGNGVEVMSTADGVVINENTPTGNVSSGNGGGSQANNSAPANSAPVNSKPVATTPSTDTSTSGKPAADTAVSDSKGSQAVNNGSTDVALSDAAPQLPSAINAGADIGQGLPTAGPAAINGEVPEPSSIALLMAGMMGALALTRRRAR